MEHNIELSVLSKYVPPALKGIHEDKIKLVEDDNLVLAYMYVY